MFQRNLTPELRRAATLSPVVTVVGPRQSGKTTLTRAVFPGLPQISLEDPDQRSRALDDPRGFLASFPDGAIFDEVQRVPDLLSYLQGVVDRDDRPGRFILTGSQNLILLDKVSQTLAGRTTLLQLLPLSIGELLRRPPFDVRAASSPEPGTTPSSVGPPVALNRWALLWQGLYPRIHDKGLPASRWLADYHRTYVERDVRDVLKIQDVDGFERFVRLCAARTAQELNLSELAADAGISQPTARAWLNALRTSFIVTLLQPFHRNFRKRLRSRPRLHFLDTGLCCYLLGIETPEILERHPLRGPIFESFVASELVKSFSNQGREPPLHFWRDVTGHEVDMVADLGDRLVPIEVKSGSTVPSDATETLRWWMDLAGKEAPSGLLVHGGDTTFVSNGVRVLPWFLG